MRADVASSLPLAFRVLGELEHLRVRQVAAGLNLTLALTTDGKVYQMGETGVASKCRWDGCNVPEQVTAAGGSKLPLIGLCTNGSTAQQIHANQDRASLAWHEAGAWRSSMNVKLQRYQAEQA